MTDIISAILALDPNAEVSVSGESLDGIEWHDGNPNNITNDQITAKQAELQAAYDSLQYQTNTSYPLSVDTRTSLPTSSFYR